MPKIIPNQRFLDGRNEYEKGKTYDVPAEKAAYFTAMGWAGEPGQNTEQNITLDIQNVTHKTSSKVKGGG